MNDMVEKVIGSHKWGAQEIRPFAGSRNLPTKLEAERKDSSEWNKKLGALPYECRSTQATERPGGAGWLSPTPMVLPRLLRGSFICTAKEKDKDPALAARESGLARAPPENVEICEENTLTPSMAAAVFDPKVQLEREKRKQEIQRAARCSRVEGMRSPQFMANIHRFELAAGSEVPSPENRVLANVKMFEEASRAQRAGPHSPDRLASGSETPGSPKRTPKRLKDYFIKPLD